ncbi:PREDICTED: UPF0496 protein At1g20180-like [Nicotiana attenuata]|uniref:Upf0496 protein n=1 Tax=Nicotiana attenuata TaxID=49451 RepID=A0A314L4B8_NICAT|nr:PREDICTED: UPF0496 protein At1g20180-like [Nicotiana attenuata]OIT36315.1 upf0496 protein [Nicotiana attenuata]
MTIDVAQRSLNVNEEYLGALRTKSYGDFFTKAQLLVNEPTSPSQLCHNTFSEILLEPSQKTIISILESTNFPSKKYDLKSLLSNYFNISAEASKFCSHILKSINQIQSDYGFVEQVLDSIDNCSNVDQFGCLVLELRSFIIHNNPFSDLKKQDFTRINDEYSSVLQRLKSKKKRVARKIKLIKCVNKTSGVVVAALVLAAHTLAAIVMGPAILSLPLKPLKKKIMNIRYLKCGFLRKVGEQLDVAAKGTYILNMDFDTMSRLVARLHNEIDHNKAMVQLCLDRREDRFSLQVLKELKKSNIGFRKQVEELEEHVYLCLLTINRARALVINEIAKSYENKNEGSC